MCEGLVLDELKKSNFVIYASVVLDELKKAKLFLVLLIFLQKNVNPSCGSLQWIDPEIFYKSVEIIQEEDKKIGSDVLTGELKKLSEQVGREARSLKLILIISVIVLCIVVILK